MAVPFFVEWCLLLLCLPLLCLCTAELNCGDTVDDNVHYAA